MTTTAPSMLPSMCPSMRPTMGMSMRPMKPRSSMRPAFRPSMRYSMRPTMVPSSRSTVLPRTAAASATEPPSTQRSATVHPRFEAAARHEAKNLLETMRLNVQFLRLLVEESGSSLEAAAMRDIHHAVDRLQNRIASWAHPRSR